MALKIIEHYKFLDLFNVVGLGAFFCITASLTSSKAFLSDSDTFPCHKKEIQLIF
jgi:hypothetical protein